MCKNLYRAKLIINNDMMVILNKIICVILEHYKILRK